MFQYGLAIRSAVAQGHSRFNLQEVFWMRDVYQSQLETACLGMRHQSPLLLAVQRTSLKAVGW